MITLQNDFISLGLDPNTFSLSTLQCRSSGRQLLVADTAWQNPFLLWTDNKKPYIFSDNKTPPDPAGLGGNCLSPLSAFLRQQEVRNDSITVLYQFKQGLVAELTISLAGKQCRLSFQISNKSEKTQSVLPVFPYLGGIDFPETEGRMLAMNQAGFVDKIWQFAGGPYGNSVGHSAQFGCFFAGDHCLGFYLADPAFSAKDIRYVKPALEVRYFPPRQLAPGATIKLPDAVFLVYQGDWRQTAKAYGDWFRQTLKPATTPAWITQLDSYTGAWAEKVGKPNGQAGLSTAMDSFTQLPRHYSKFPVECFEYALYCEHSARDANRPDGTPLGPQPRRHTDGWNVVRQDLGGYQALRQGIKLIHDLGRKLTLYIEGLIVPQDSELFQQIPQARDWLIENPDGSNTGPYTESEWVHMCPGCSQWQDHVAAMAARLMRETGADGVRLDSYSFYFWPCYNKSHQHDSPFDHNVWQQEIFAKVAAAVKAVKPDALLATESPVDYNFVHFNYALHQSFDPAKLRQQLTDTAPLAVALPDYRVCQWTGGALAQTLRLLPDGSGRRPGTDFDRLLRNWQNIRPAVSQAYYYGDNFLANPITSAPDLSCRRLETDSETLVFGTRPDLSAALEKDLQNGLIHLVQNTASAQVSLPLAQQPLAAWIFDLERQDLSTLEYSYADQTLQFATDAAWFLVLLVKKTGPLPVIMTGQEEVRPATAFSLTVSSPALTAARSVRLTVDGVTSMSTSFTAPGRLELKFPAATPPGQYIIRLTGQDIRPVVKVMTVL